MALEEILGHVEEILPGKKEMTLLALAVCVSHFVDKQTPLWLMFVGVPASAKTEVVRLISNNPNVKSLDSLTENAFVSGAINVDKSTPKDLLPLLNDKCFVIKDFTTTLSQREESVKKILGDLTSIYDDTFEKHSAMRGTVSYHSFFSILGCVTPQALNQHQRYINQIGPRFLFYRVPSSTNEETDKALDMIWSLNATKEKKEEVRQEVSDYSNQITTHIQNINLEKEALEIQNYIRDLAKFIARARGIVLTRAAKFENDEGKEIVYYEPYDIQIEEPHRAARQLKVLARSLAVVLNKQKVGQEELAILKKVALSSMPADRSALISIISKENKLWIAKEVSNLLGISHKTTSRQLDELVSLGIIDKHENGSGLSNEYSVKDSFKGIVYDGEFMSSSATETETPHRTNTDNITNPDEITVEDIDKMLGVESVSTQ